MADVARILKELETASRGLDEASERLSRLTWRFEGYYDETEEVDPETGEIVKKRGEWHQGPSLLFETAVTVAMESVRQDYIDRGEKVPAVEMVERLARIRVEKEKPDLFADYHRLRIEIDALQMWIRSRNKTISSRQSILKAEGVLASL